MKKKEKRILEEIEEFLEYVAKGDENARKEKNLKKKFGEERYKAIYDLIGGKYTGGLLKKEGKEKNLVLHINNEGLKFLEEYEREGKKLKYSKYMMYATVGLAIITLFYVGFIYQSNQIISSQFESENVPLIYLESIQNDTFNNNTVKFDLQFINVGRAPGRIQYVMVDPGVCGKRQIMNEFGETPLLLSNERKTLVTVIYESNTDKEHPIGITTYYRGIGNMKDELKDYPTTISINTKLKSVDIAESIF